MFSLNLYDICLSFLSILFEGIPFLLLGSLLSGLVDVFVSSERLAKILPKNPFAAIFISGGLGLIFPMCECGSVIVIRRFIRKGLPISCAVTYMLGAPIVSPIVALSTYKAFPMYPELMTSMRLLMGYVIAVGAGYLVHFLDPRKILQPGILADATHPRSGLRFAAAPAAINSGDRDFADIAGRAPLPRKLLMAVQSATADFLDVAFFFVIGCAIASCFNTGFNQQIIQQFATMPLPSILVLMGFASILALCSTTDAFIAASFIKFPFAAKLAFLVFGPIFDLKLFWLYGLLFKRRAVIVMSAGLFVVIAFLCWRIADFNLDTLAK